MSDHKIKRHNKSLLLYHIVIPLKYRRNVINKEVGETLIKICFEITERFEVEFIEIGYELDHVHFLVQSVPSYSVSKMITMLKSITAKQLFQRHPEVKSILWNGKFWTSGYYVNTVGQYSNEEVIRAYVKNQGKEKEYKKLHQQQLKLLF